ncbi:hypothetical protein P5V15_001660 [Pogonomyrmex californicus]
MSCIVERYFNLNRILLLLVGLWPYQKSKLAQFQLICFFSILVTFIVFQLTTFMTLKCTINNIIKILSDAFSILILVIKYNSFYINSNTVKYSMEQLQRIHDDLKDSNEIAIIEKYGNDAKRYTTILTMFLFCSLSIAVSAQLWPDLMYIISFANESRYRLYFSTEYFIDQERYFYLLLLHTNAAICIGLIVLLATGTLLIAYFQHACGMFKIASYRIENALEIYVSKVNLKNEYLVYRGLIYAVHIHQKAMMFSEYVISRFEISFMLLIFFGVITTSLKIYQIFQIVSTTYNIEELLLTFIGTLFCLLYMFLANLVGQNITDHYNLVSVTAYEVRWYITPPQIQKMILFLLQRGTKTFGLNVGGLFIASLECFATLANASLSYFTVMYSMQ